MQEFFKTDQFLDCILFSLLFGPKGRRSWLPLQGISIEDEPDGSLLIVQNLQSDDAGLIECVAVNSVGKAIASSQLTVICPPRFLLPGLGNNGGPLVYEFLKDELVRIKFDYEAVPAPQARVVKGGQVEGQNDLPPGCEVSCREGVVVFRVEAVSEEHVGLYRIKLENELGTAVLEFQLKVPKTKTTFVNRRYPAILHFLFKK